MALTRAVTIRFSEEGVKLFETENSLTTGQQSRQSGSFTELYCVVSSSHYCLISHSSILVVWSHLR